MGANCQYTINSTAVTGTSSIYNLGTTFEEVFSIHIEPITYSVNVNGFNEVSNNSLWLLEANRISITLDATTEYPINKNSAGSRVTNPIIYRRTNLPSKKQLQVLENGEEKTIQPLYGSDSSIIGSDWIRRVNSTTYPLLVINSLPCSGNEQIDRRYFLDHLVNENLDDVILFEVNILSVDAAEIALIEQQLLHCRFVFKRSVYNKQMTHGIKLYHSNAFRTQEDFGVKY